MLYGLYLSANGLVTQDMRTDVIANNLANTSTNGFKRDFLALRQRDIEVLRNGGIPGPQTNRHLLAIGGAVEGDRSHSIHKQGPLQRTENPLDIALNGEGFFKFTDGNGKILYSRGGALTVTPDGVLTGPGGHPILSIDGAPIFIEGEQVEIDDTGRVIVDNEAVAQIAVISPDKVENLHKLGENFYEAIEPIEELASTAQIRSGHLEGSSVSAVMEMTSMIQANRAYQANAKMISIQDETLGKAISQIAL